MSLPDPLILAELARFDRDAHALVQVSPAPLRPALAALYGFNLEIAKIREIVRDGLTGQFRLQWWRDAIEEIFTSAEPRRHPVAQAIATAAAAHGWTRAPFERMLDARAFDLEDRAPRDLDELMHYVQETAAPMLMLAAEALGASAGLRSSCAEAAQHTARARGLAGLLVSIPFHARQARHFIPDSVAAAAGFHPQAMIDRLKPVEGLRQAVETLHTAAMGEARAAQAAIRALPRSLRPAFLPLALARDHLQALRAAACDPFDVRVKTAQRFRYVKLSIAAIAGRP